MERALRAGDHSDQATWLLRYVERYSLEEVAEACSAAPTPMDKIERALKAADAARAQHDHRAAARARAPLVSRAWLPPWRPPGLGGVELRQAVRLELAAEGLTVALPGKLASGTS